MRVLVTGATGFVGSWLCEELARSWPEAEVWGTAFGAPAAEGITPAHLLPCDLTDAAAVVRLVETVRPDRVFHLAGFASAAGTDEALVRKANVEATAQLLESLTRWAAPCHALLASTGYVYGPTVPGQAASEEDAPAPLGIYAESKLEMEKAARSLNAAGVLRVTVTRAFNHTGPRQSPSFVVPAFSRQIARIEHGLDPPVVQVGNLDAVRDFLDVRDVVRAYLLLLEERRGGPPASFSLVNVASGEGVKVADLLDRLLALSTVPIQVAQDPGRLRASDLPCSVGSPRRLQEWTGWHPEIPLERTLKDTLDWWRARER